MNWVGERLCLSDERTEGPAADGDGVPVMAHLSALEDSCSPRITMLPMAACCRWLPVPLGLRAPSVHRHRLTPQRDQAGRNWEVENAPESLSAREGWELVNRNLSVLCLSEKF